MIVPRFTQDRCVILSDGGVESLLASAMASEQHHLAGHQSANSADESDTSRSSILLPAWWEWTDEIDLMISAADPAIVRQAGVYGLDIFPNQSVYPPDDAQLLSECPIGSIQSRMLLEAAQIALRAGIRKLVWPIRVMRPETKQPMDELVSQIGQAIDRAILASRLASLDANDSSAVDIVIETPFIDLSNHQMSDLVADLAIPIETCWWHDARTLPHAHDRSAYWSQMGLRTARHIESKPRPQTPA